MEIRAWKFACDIIAAATLVIVPWRLFELTVHKRIGYTLGQGTFYLMCCALVSLALYRMFSAVALFWPEWDYAEVASALVSAVMMVACTIRLYMRSAQVLRNGHLMEESMRAMQKSWEDARDTSAGAVH
jgi:hypothetical protein